MTNRNYKDSLFIFIFNHEENRRYLLSLYNALSGASYTDEKLLKITTLEDVVYINYKNDVSFLIGSEMYLLEHQSSYNPNMPIRGFLYFAQLYKKYLTEHKLNKYSSKLLKLPAPYYFVFYNGLKTAEDKVILKLSDSFEKQSPGFEWTAVMYNINHGHNAELMQNCKCLQDYALYIKMVRNYIKDGYSPEEAAGKAVDDASELKLLDGFFARHKAEVMNDFLTDFDKDLYEKTMREEGFEEGLVQGREEGREEGLVQGIGQGKIQFALNMLKAGYPEDEVFKLAGFTPDLVEEIRDSIKQSGNSNS